MKALSVWLMLALFVMGIASSCTAFEVPEDYSDEIEAVDFYPSGARFTFASEPDEDTGEFRVVLPGSFTASSVRVLNPENVEGDISVKQYQRTRWVPSQLEDLKAETDDQALTVSELTAKKSSLEQTLNLLKNSQPDKSKPDDLLSYIKDAQELRLETENELAQLNIELAEEKEKLNMLTRELNSRRPGGETSYLVVTGKAEGTVRLEATTHSASWSPRYTMDLNSETGEIDAHLYIRAAQRTGLEYEGAMTFHTKTPDENITTPVLNPLKVAIKPKEETIASTQMASYSRSNRMMYKAAPMMADTVAMEDAEELEAGSAPMAPSVQESLSDRVLNVKGILPGDGTEQEYEAGAFTLTCSPVIMVIPEQRNNAWIIASMDEGNERLIPGTADLRVDGHASGRIYLEEFGTGQKRIPFGYAEQITVKKEALVEKTGVSWFSGVFTSGYKLEITNGTKDDKRITIRDRLPVPTDEKIKLDVKRIEPKQKERDPENRLTWEFTIPAGGTVPIIVDYTLSYPSGEELEYK